MHRRPLAPFCLKRTGKARFADFDCPSAPIQPSEWGDPRGVRAWRAGCAGTQALGSVSNPPIWTRLVHLKQKAAAETLAGEDGLLERLFAVASPGVDSNAATTAAAQVALMAGIEPSSAKERHGGRLSSRPNRRLKPARDTRHYGGAPDGRRDEPRG